MLNSQIPIENPNSISKMKPISGQKIKEKSNILVENLKIFHFTPDPQIIISVSFHEKLFRKLNLWDFANLELDFEIKKNLLIEFIASYDSSKHSAYVGGQRINLTLADLSKALSLPTINHKFANLDFNVAEFGGPEKVSDILWKFIFKKIVMSEDVASLSDEVANATSLVEAGSPNKVDWAGLILVLLENEILDAPSSGYCHYATHLQCLMKFQKPRLFEELDSMEFEPSEATVVEDDCVAEEAGTVLSLGIDVDSKMNKMENEYDLSNFQCHVKKEIYVDVNEKDDNMDKMVEHAEEQDNGEEVEGTSKDCFVDSSKLTKGNIDMGKTVTDIMDCQKENDTSKDDFVDSSKLIEGDIDMSKTLIEVVDGEKVENTLKDNFIDSNKITKGDIDMVKTVTDVMDVELAGFHKGKKVEGRVEGDAMNFELGSLNRNDDNNCTIVNDVMYVGIFGPNEGSNGKEDGESKFPNFYRFNSSGFLQPMETNNNLLLNESIDHQNRDDLSIERSDMHMNLELGQDGSFYFANELKRCNEETNHHVDDFHHKRLRSDQPLEQTPTITNLNQLGEELNNQMEKIEMDVMEMERQYTDIMMQVQHVNKLLQSKDEIIQRIKNSRMEAIRKRQLEATRFDQDLKYLTKIFYGYKKAFKDTENRFAEYRAKYPISGKKCDNKLDVEDSKQCLEKKCDNELDVEHSKQCLEKKCDNELNVEDSKQCLEIKKKVHQVRSIISDFSEACLENFDNLCKSFAKLMEKLLTVKEQVDALKESVAKAKNEALD